MVCMAVFLCGMAQDMTGKYVGIWFPISTFVMIGFEHIPANFYLCEIGLLADKSEVTFVDVLVKNWIPVTLGNFIAGAFIVAAGYSYVYGRFGQIIAQKLEPKKEEPAKLAGELEDTAKAVVPTADVATVGQKGPWDRCVSEGSIHGM
eukprot:TRINITY_DN1791_c0_g1_i1.p2 TRINITY_DN1791_c0_g1~~TRINITY_DN1791_c0_g1_i1.p2  ORF type:complete len:148 (+),score=38.83 TRINITY_DN1791_c0_g1_i1:3-446(+)